MTTEDRLDDQGLKPEDQEDLHEEQDELSEEEQGIQSLEDQIAEVSNAEDDESEQADEESEQPASDEGSEGGELEAEAEDELPENADKKTKQAFIKLRLEKKKLREELEQERNSKAETHEVERKPTETEEQPKATAEDVLSIYLRALNDELTDDELETGGSAERIIQLAETALTKQLSSADIYKAINNAIETNSPDKDDIIDIGNKYLSLARYREEVESKDVAQATVQQRTAFESELKQVAEAYPEIVQADSPLAVFTQEWDKRMLGAVIDGKPVQGELEAGFAEYLRQHPLQHAKMIVDSFNLSVKSGEKAKEVIKKTERKRAVLGSGESGSLPLPADGGKKIRTAEDIESDLEALSAEAD